MIDNDPKTIKSIVGGVMDFTEQLVERTKRLARDCDALEFTFDGYVYNPLDYAWKCHEQFLRRYVRQSARALFLGMNPGPFGMMQTGVPFGEITAVVEYLKIYDFVGSPKKEHPGRPVLGLSTTRSEVSGRRLWGLIKEQYPNPEDFPKDIAMFNYCPLGFLMNTKTAKNETPDHLAKEERVKLEEVCNSYLSDVIELVNPQMLVGVGKYAQDKLMQVNTDPNRLVFSIIHPSPGNPQANNGWADKTRALLKEKNLWN